MSTRCQIGFYENKEQSIHKPSVLLYKHCDGYPEGVVPIITPFLIRFAKERGINDTEYCSAWLLHCLIQEHVESAIERRAEWSKTMDVKFMPKDGKDFLGYGICEGFHGDIEYFYRIYPNCLEVYEASSDRNDNMKFKFIETINI